MDIKALVLREQAIAKKLITHWLVESPIHDPLCESDYVIFPKAGGWNGRDIEGKVAGSALVCPCLKAVIEWWTKEASNRAHEKDNYRRSGRYTPPSVTTLKHVSFDNDFRSTAMYNDLEPTDTQRLASLGVYDFLPTAAIAMLTRVASYDDVTSETEGILYMMNAMWTTRFQVALIIDFMHFNAIQSILSRPPISHTIITPNTFEGKQAWTPHHYALVVMDTSWYRDMPVMEYVP